MAQPTIKDVAKLAGVSISTVSRVMNKSKPVSPEVEKRVLEAINKLGFRPNELARSLVMKKSNSIGILVKDIGIEYMAQIIRGAEEIGRMYDYDILLSSTYGELDLKKKAVDFFYRKQVEGVIIVDEDIESEIIIKIREYRMPYILLDPDNTSNEKATVTVNYRHAMRELVQTLVDMGNQHLVYIRSMENSHISNEKFFGYQEVIRKHQLSLDTLETRTSTIEEGYEISKMIKKPDLVICESDPLAIGVMNYCTDHFIHIPEDTQVTGFGGTSISSIYRPRLTTVVVPYYDIGAVAMRFLIKTLMEEETLEETIFLPTQLVFRESTKNTD